MRFKNEDYRNKQVGHFGCGVGSIIDLSVKDLEHPDALALSKLLSVYDDRSDKAKRTDKSIIAKTVLKKTPENIELWNKNKNLFDLEGVDD
jgi:hypothetical protein